MMRAHERAERDRAWRIVSCFPESADWLVFAAFRYYLGRATGSACYFARGLGHAWPDLDARVRALIRRELEEAFTRDDEARAQGGGIYPLGHDMDRKAWERVREAWKLEDGR